MLAAHAYENAVTPSLGGVHERGIYNSTLNLVVDILLKHFLLFASHTPSWMPIY